MDLYKEILKLTERIEKALRQENSSENLVGLIETRVSLFAQLEANTDQASTINDDLIKKIRASEERCITLATEKKQMIKKEIKNTQSNKRRHTAYTRQMASVS